MFLHVVGLIGVGVSAVSGALAVADSFGLATIVRGLRIPAFTLDRE